MSGVRLVRITLTPDQEERYGKEVRLVMQEHGVSSSTPWEDLPEWRKRPHKEAALAAIFAYRKEQLEADDEDADETR
jgi:hypothetical protein